MDETQVILKPRFGGTKGKEYGKLCERIERMFLEHLQVIEILSSTILDVQATCWFDDMVRFREEIKDLELLIENLITSVFKSVSNVQEGIEALYGFYNYTRRDSVKTLFDRKTTTVRFVKTRVILDSKILLP